MISTSGVLTFNSYWYWGSTQYHGSTPALNLGNLGFITGGGNPTATAFYFGFVDATQNYDLKSQSVEGVHCMQALPI